MIFVATEDEMNGSKPFPLTVVDWASKKLTRVCRSSLAAEAQTMATAVDQLEWTKTMFALMIWPNQRPDNEDVMKWLGESPVITMHEHSMMLATRWPLEQSWQRGEPLSRSRSVWKGCKQQEECCDGATAINSWLME